MHTLMTPILTETPKLTKISNLYKLLGRALSRNETLHFPSTDLVSLKCAYLPSRSHTLTPNVYFIPAFHPN